MSKCQEKQIIIKKNWSNLPPNHRVNNVNNFEGPSSAINPFILVKSREKHGELIIAAHSIVGGTLNVFALFNVKETSINNHLNVTAN